MIGRKPYIIGVDVGGTKILIEVFDRKMNLLAEEKVKTQVKKGEKGFLAQLHGLIGKYFTGSVKAIGIAAPGIVNMEKGTLVKAPHLPTKKDFPLKKLTEARFKVPVRVDNDINAFLTAEKERPALQKYQNIVAGGFE
jgi:glucokinase